MCFIICDISGILEQIFMAYKISRNLAISESVFKVS